MFSQAEISKLDFAVGANKYICSFYISAKQERTNLVK